mgnify:CR=1 FL=1
MDEPVLDVTACVERVRAGDEDAARVLMQHLHGLIVKIVRSHLPRRTSEEDLIQAVYVKVFTRIDQYRGAVPFEHWVSRVAVNTCLNHLKLRRNRTPHLSLNDLDVQPENDPDLVALVSENTPRRDASLAELQRRLNEAILKLSEDHRTVVTLHDIQGLPHEQIAKILKVNPGTVRSRLFYAHQQLQGWLSDWMK